MKAYKDFLKATLPSKDNHQYGQDLDAYMAGFFDGEGHITVSCDERRKWGPYVEIGVTNTVLAPLELFQKSYGGYVRIKQTPVENKRCWKWRASGKDAFWALARMLPWLRVKKEKARWSLIILKNKPLAGVSGGQVSKYQKMAVTKAMKRIEHVVRISREARLPNTGS